MSNTEKGDFRKRLLWILGHQFSCWLNTEFKVILPEGVRNEKLEMVRVMEVAYRSVCAIPQRN